MIFAERKVLLKDGRTAILRPPRTEEAGEMLALMRRMSGETPFILRYPEEWDNTPVEDESAFLQNQRDNPCGCFVTAEVDGRLAGNCQTGYNPGIKTRHRGSVAIAIAREYWNLGLGTAMFALMIEVARDWGCTQLELDFVEGNSRARALYEKMGFAIVGVKPDAIRLKDGTLLREYSMVKKL